VYVRACVRRCIRVCVHVHVQTSKVPSGGEVDSSFKSV